MSSAPTTGCTSEQGALRGEHPGRSANPVIKIQDVLWLEFESRILPGPRRSPRRFGFTTALRTQDELHLRGADPGAPCVLIRRGPRSRFVGPAFVAAQQSDLLRLADATGGTVPAPLPETLAGWRSSSSTPAGWRCASCRAPTS